MTRKIILLLALCLGLTGCAQNAPQRAADGSAWSEEWVTVGGVLGVDTPEGFAARENNDALAASGMYYATWSIGEETPYTNAGGDEALLYDAQVYLLLAGHSSLEKAESAMAEWLDMASGQYRVNSTQTGTCNGQDFTVLTYTFDSDTNPYERGASAFGVYGNYAVTVELSCRESFTGDALDTLTNFLDHCHYGA